MRRGAQAHPHAHPHRIYAVRQSTSDSVQPYGKRKSPPSPVSHRLASTSLAVSEPPPSPIPPPLCVLVTATCKKRAVVESSCHRLCPVTHRAPFYQEGEHTGQTYLSQQ